MKNNPTKIRPKSFLFEADYELPKNATLRIEVFEPPKGSKFYSTQIIKGTIIYPNKAEFELPTIESLTDSYLWTKSHVYVIKNGNRYLKEIFNIAKRRWEEVEYLEYEIGDLYHMQLGHTPIFHNVTVSPEEGYTLLKYVETAGNPEDSTLYYGVKGKQIQYLTSILHRTIYPVVERGETGLIQDGKLWEGTITKDGVTTFRGYYDLQTLEYMECQEMAEASNTGPAAVLK